MASSNNRYFREARDGVEVLITVIEDLESKINDLEDQAEADARTIGDLQFELSELKAKIADEILDSKFEKF